MSLKSAPSLQALRAFECVARHGSFKKASNELCVTPGALSQLVKKLESNFNVCLLKRENRSISLTLEGAYLSQGLQKAFAQINDSVSSMRKQTSSNVIRVGAAQPILTKWLVPRLDHFFEEYPNIDVHFTQCSGLKDLWEESIDIVIRLSSEEEEALSQRSYASESMVLAVSPSFVKRHRLFQPKDLLRVPLISTNTKLIWPDFPSWPDVFATLGLAITYPSRKLSLDFCLEQAIDAAIAGAGVIILPRILASDDLLNQRLVAIFEKDYALTLRCRYQVITRFELSNNLPAKSLSNWLARHLAFPPMLMGKSALDTSEPITKNS